ncbi:hypothetical protein ABBQ32_006546 [Trebouxia sp. C0010 RCD-2024]
MIVPKFVDINHGIDRRPRSDRPVARSARDRTRSPHMHRSPVRSRADHPAPYERRRDAEVPRQAQHAAARHATEPVWPELHAPPSGRKVEDFVRPHLDRAPIRTPDFAWEPAHYDRGASHNAYPPAAEYDYRHAQPEYHEPIGREAGYRAPVYREATFSETGYAAAAAAAQGRDVGYRQPSSYDYDEPAYREYTGSRAIDGPHSSYTRGGPGWDAPRFPDPRHDAYPHRYSASDDRWHEREVRQLPVRENPRLPRADREAVALTRGGSYPYSRHDRGHEGMLPAHDDPRHAPRLAHEYAAPSPRSFRDGLHQASRDVREAPRSVSRDVVYRHAEVYASAVGHAGDPYAARRAPPPLAASRRPSPRGRSPRKREPSPARDDRRHRETTHRSYHEAKRPSDRAGQSLDRVQPRGRDALKLTSRSFALEAAAAKNPAPEAAEPGQLDVADLPPPPAVDAPKAAPSRDAKPSRASAAARPATAAKPVAEPKPEGEDTSPVLSVQQGFLSEGAPPAPALTAAGDRPFQRGQRPQHPPDSTLAKSKDTAAKVDGSGRESEQRSSRDHAGDGARGKDAKKPSAVAEAKHDRGHSGGLDSRAEPSSRHEEASHKGNETDARHKEAAKTGGDKRSDTARRTSTADRDERHKGKPSSGSKDAAKAGLARHSPTVKASPSAAKTNNASSKDKPASERGPDLKKPLRSAAKPDAAAAKGEKAAGKGDSRSQAVVEKQAGRKRRSRSGERSRSPKRKATSPAARNSGKESGKAEGTSSGKEQQLPPPPARTSSAYNEGDLPPPPIRVAAKTAAEQGGERVPNGTDVALPPPPPKPQSSDKGHAKRDSTKPTPPDEGKPTGKPAGKPSASASPKDASAKRASAKDESAKDVSARTKSAEVVSTKDTSAKSASAKSASKDVSPKSALAKGALAKPSGRGRTAKADTKKPAERQSAAGRSSSHKASEKAVDKGHLLARDSRRGSDRLLNGRAGQKRARSRSPQKPLDGSKAADSSKRQAKATNSKRVDPNVDRLLNGTSERSRDADKESRKEWMYDDKAADYLRFPVWRDGDRRKNQQMRDVLTV